jgi:hypothetical protein
VSTATIALALLVGTIVVGALWLAREDAVNNYGRRRDHDKPDAEHL